MGSSQNSNTTLILKTRSETAEAVHGKEYKILHAEDATGIKGTGSVNFISEDQNRHVEWTYDSVTHTFKAKNNTYNELLKVYSKKDAEERMQAPKDSDFDRIVKDNAFMSIEQEKESEDRQSVLEPADATRRVAEVASLNVIDRAISSVSTRVVSFRTMSPASSPVSDTSSKSIPAGRGGLPKVQKETVGVASGDESSFSQDESRYGIWGSPFYGQATQKSRGQEPGYKSKSYGGTIGFDYLANDNMILGAALTIVGTNLNHKDKKLGDKTRADTTMFSLYAVHDLPKNFFVQGLVSFGSTKVKNSETRKFSSGNKIANGKYDSTTYVGDITVGYNFRVPESLVLLTPTAGLRYAKFNDEGYKETGASFRSAAVRKKSNSKIEGTLGVRASMSTEVNDVTFTPEVHSFVNYDFKGQTPKVEATISGKKNSLESKASKPAKLLVNVGTSLNLKYHMMEYGFGYDANFAKKYIGHQGSLKIRVNF